MGEASKAVSGASTAATRGDYVQIWDHIKPGYLIRVTESYIVYLDRDGILEWETTPAYDEKGPADTKKNNSILSDVAVLECNPCHGLSPQVTEHFKRLLGEALAWSIEHNYANAKQMLREAESYIRSRSEEVSRRWYLSASAIMAAVMIGIGLLIWIARDSLSALIAMDGIWLCLAVAAGSAGGLLSVIWRTGKLKFDCSAGRELHYLEGASRIWAGGLSGLLAALAVKSEFILAPLARGENAFTVIMLTAFAAGAGERLATSIISKVDSTHLATDNEKKGKERSEESDSD